MPLVEEEKLQFDVAELPLVNARLVGVHVANKPLAGVTAHDSVREPAKPLRLASVTVEEPVEPTGKVTVAGLAVTLKSGDETT